jgi:acyl-CoA thioesterase I
MAAALALSCAAIAPASAAEQAPCPTVSRTAFLQGELPRAATRLGLGRPLKIVAIGSSSTAGAGASSAANSYPNQLETELSRRFPGRDIDVVNVGVNGQEVPDMLARLDRDVLDHSPDLVIWQFGSNGLMRGRPTEEMEGAARVGIDRLQRAGVDVMLMDLQHAPRIDGVSRRDDVLQMMKRLSESTGAALFHRYRMMKAWAASLGASYAQMLAPDQLHMTDTSYRCLAGVLAAGLQGAADRQLAARRSRGDLTTTAVRFPAPPARAASAP